MKNLLTDYELFEQQSVENRLLHKEEQLIFEVTEALAEALQKEGMTKSELARKLGKSKGFVSQVLAGNRNLTLRTIAQVSAALGCEAGFRIRKQVPISNALWQGSRVDWNTSVQSSFKIRPSTPVVQKSSALQDDKVAA